jgi:hypothetical protein
MRLARFPSSPRFACTLAFLAICLAPGFGVKAAGSGAAKLPMTHGTARVQSPRAEVPTVAARPYDVHLSLPPPKSLVAPSKSEPRTQARIIEASDSQPLIFEPNQGQTDDLVKFLSRGRGYTLFLTGNEAVLALRSRQSSLASSQLQRTRDYRPRTTDRLLPSSIDSQQSSIDNPSPLASLVLRMKLVGADPKARVSGLDALPSTSNYFIGNDPKKWWTHIPNYAKVQYKNVYPGVDLVYYGNERQLEYDFVVAPGADPHSIALAIVGGEAGRQSLSQPLVQIDRNGNLVMQTEGGKVHLRKPVVYQLSQQEGRPTFVDGSYVLRASRIQGPKSEFTDREYEFCVEVAAYDHTKPLIIDPVLSYSTYLGGSQDDGGNSIAVDSSGSAYVAGSTLSANFPTVTPLQGTCGGCDIGATDVFVAKLDAAGSSLVYTTYLGGGSFDQAFAITTDSSGNVYVTGRTYSTDFPTVNPVQPTIGGWADIFMAKLDATGSTLVYSTYLGGSSGEQGLGIAVDSAGNAYVVGSTLSKDFPVASPLQATCVSCNAGDPDAFVTKLDAAGASLVYSTYLGGSGSDEARSIAVDGTSNAYVTGLTYSNNFPLVSPLQPAYGGVEDAFVLKMDSSGSALVYSTYLGGTNSDEGLGIALDSSGNAYVTGWTTSNDFPTANAAQSAYKGGQDAFVAKLDGAGATLAYSTYLGGNGADQGSSIAVDPSGQAYVTGYTTSTNLPLANPIQPTYGGNQDAFVSKLSATGVALVFSTYLGGHDVDTGTGVAVDSAANPYVTGATFSNDFPTASPMQAATGGGYDAFVAKLAELAAPAVTLSATNLVFPDQAVATTSTPQTVTLTNAGDAALAITSIEITGDFAQTNTCGSAVAAGANCTIDITFTPTVAGVRTGTITITDDAAGSPRVVPLGGIGVAPSVFLSRAGLSFSNQGIGTTSAPQTLTLTNIGNAPLTISGVAVSGDFAETNTCGASVAAGANCEISVTFTPTATGTRTGTLTITDDAAGSPHVVQLAGGGTAPFTLSSPNSTATVARSTDTTTFSVSASTQFGFTGSISLSCSGSAPANCAFNPASIAPGESSTLTVSNLNAVSASGLNFAAVGTSDSQTASLSLTILFPDFSMLATPGVATISAGQPATYTLSLIPLNGFSEAVSLSCSRAPTAASCTVLPSSVTLNGTSTSTATVTVTTAAPSIGGFRHGPSVIPPPLGNPVGLRWFAGLLVLITVTSLWKATQRARVALAVMMLLVLAWTACSVGGSEKPPYTPSGNYQLIVTATAPGGLEHSIAVGLAVR